MTFSGPQSISVSPYFRNKPDNSHRMGIQVTLRQCPVPVDDSPDDHQLFIHKLDIRSMANRGRFAHYSEINSSYSYMNILGQIYAHFPNFYQIYLYI